MHSDRMKFAVIVFPGSNCDRDMYHAVVDALGQDAGLVSSDEKSLEGYDGVLLPGGFSFGDYLRSGAIAARTNIVPAIKDFVHAGKPVLGVCNGFQVLTEMGLLPGALLRNKDMKFICKPATLRVENCSSIFTSEYGYKEEISIPIAHGEGNYFADNKTLKKLKDQNRIAFTYKDNINGSARKIAGILNERGNVLGMMPHPERAVEKLLGSADGLRLFKSILNSSNLKTHQPRHQATEDSINEWRAGG